MLKNRIPESSIAVEREWVLPTHLREKWSLRAFADVFDSIPLVPPGEGEEDGGKGKGKGEKGEEGVGNRRGGKRVLLATVSDDSTVVYYVVHEGVVKPRQN